MKTCNICKTTYRGNVCPECGAVPTTTKYTAKRSSVDVATHWRAILRYDALIPDIWTCSSIILGHAILLGYVSSVGDAVGYRLADTATWYIFTAFVCWLLFFPKSEPLSRHDKLITAAIGICACIALRLILTAATGMITGIFIPMCTLVVAYVIPIIATHKLRRSHIDALTGVQTDDTYWAHFAKELEQEWHSKSVGERSAIASESFMREVYDRYADKMGRFLEKCDDGVIQCEE